eukprot:CAMPEP_0172565584 /NCGR_PEP_ID=MMETSP1067-20121228/108762_1 /TAXON_ID=265564 ORGANISM="Thalassiosira punctigera, Strain Tpunct2005C2" /NCGR_SAMPLE_ID=MMETSP1067 /ASSEMBLY_ACC=CAM_ASM_000444 /LENGTH=94 /DNA_ID=CAMNT_0013356501 /DNA_START=19 /DNA_END=303 /DNA_ORIENTATION=+
MTSKNIVAMIAIVDVKHDGVIDRGEFHTLVNMATLRAIHKEQKNGTLGNYRVTFAPIPLNQMVSNSGNMKPSGIKHKEEKDEPVFYGAISDITH